MAEHGQRAGATRRRLVRVGGAALGGAGVTACAFGGFGGLGGRPGGAAGAELKTGVKLLAVGWGGPPAAQARSSIVAHFMEQYPGLSADYADREGGNAYFDTLQAELAAG